MEVVEVERVESLGLRVKALCGYQGCDKTVHAKSLCKAHYMQQLRGESLHDLPAIPKYCSFSGCKREHHAKGLCKGHYYQVYRGEELRALLPDVGGYGAVHDRLRRQYGRAVESECVLCGSQAQEWAFIGNPETSLYKDIVGRRGKPTRIFFSRDLTEYRPMCHSCHVEYDMQVKSRGWQPWACA